VSEFAIILTPKEIAQFFLAGSMLQPGVIRQIDARRKKSVARISQEVAIGSSQKTENKAR
jgi:hypothetical protein